MAKKGPEHEDDEDGEDEKPAPAAKSGLKKILIIATGAVLLISISVGATLFVAGAFSKPAADDEDDAPVAEKVDKKDKKKKSAKDAKKGKDPAKPVTYLPLDPPFVINVLSQGNLRYVQVGLEVATREPGVAEDVKKHMPAIRNNLLMMLGSQNFEQAGSRETHEGIRAAALTEIQKVMQEQIGKPGVESVYITSFVMQ